MSESSVGQRNVLRTIEKFWWLGGIAFICLRVGLARGVVVEVLAWLFPVAALVSFLVRKWGSNRSR
jgi:hypothetical protein